MTGEVALVMETKVAGTAFERIRRFVRFSFVFGSLVMVLQAPFRAEGKIATVTVEGLCTQSLGYAVCLM